MIDHGSMFYLLYIGQLLACVVSSFVVVFSLVLTLLPVLCWEVHPFVPLHFQFPTKWPTKSKFHLSVEYHCNFRCDFWSRTCDDNCFLILDCWLFGDSLPQIKFANSIFRHTWLHIHCSVYLQTSDIWSYLKGSLWDGSQAVVLLGTKFFYWLVSRWYGWKIEVLSVFKSGSSWRQNGTSPFDSLCSADEYLGKG